MDIANHFMDTRDASKEAVGESIKQPYGHLPDLILLKGMQWP